MHSTAPSAVSKSFSPWRVVSVGDAALLLLAMARGAPHGNWHLSGRCLSPRRLPFWILGSPLGLKLPLVCILHQEEHEVRLYVPVLTGRRPERYHHLRPLLHALRKLLWLILQHGCSGIPSEVRKGDLMNRLLPRWPAGQWFTSFLHDLLTCHVQEDGGQHHDWHHLAHL